MTNAHLEDLATRLAWRYPPERVRDILAGRDEATQRYLWLWRRLGDGFGRRR